MNMIELIILIFFYNLYCIDLVLDFNADSYLQFTFFQVIGKMVLYFLKHWNNYKLLGLGIIILFKVKASFYLSQF